MNYLEGNPYEEVARTHADQSLATLALAWEIRTLVMMQHPWVEHETVTKRMKENND